MSASRQQNREDSSAVVLDLVIKLGGAAITDKSTNETLRVEDLRQGAALIRLCHDAGQRVAVVHGAGSFGHFQAKKYCLNDGLKEEGNYQGFCETRNSVCKLNRHVVDCLTEQGLPAVSCPAFPAWQTCDGAVTQWPKEAISSVVTAGLLPVFHGDVVLDTKRGFCVLSGDTIIQILCPDFRVKRVVFLTDVSGVYNRPPTEEDAELLRVVRLKEGKVCADVKLSASTHDVTGGMSKKISSAHQIVVSSSGQTRVFVSKIGSPDAQKLCMEKDVDITKLAATEIVYPS